MKKVRAEEMAIKHLEWDSNHFGIKIGKVEAPEHLGQAKHLYDFLQAEVEPGSEKISFLTQHGFTQIEARVTLSAPTKITSPSGQDKSLRVKPAEKSQLFELKKLFKEVEFFTRYRKDPNFPQDKVKSMYELWCEKAVQGTFDHTCLVLWQKATPIGFCSLRLSPPNAHIGLIAVSNEFTGKNHSRILLSGVLDFLNEKGIKECFVTTQGDNAKAIRAYENAGFRIQNVSLFFHWWKNKLPVQAA